MPVFSYLTRITLHSVNMRPQTTGLRLRLDKMVVYYSFSESHIYQKKSKYLHWLKAIFKTYDKQMNFSDFNFMIGYSLYIKYVYVYIIHACTWARTYLSSL